METIAAGMQLIQLMTLVYRSDRPVLLHGKHGVGKSELLAQAARELGIGFEVRDLSLMEPTDLAGIPQVEADGRTHYATPSFLPRDGRGLLVFEELNRCPKYMQAPCLQLLTSRRLNDYQLPAGWLPCAAINDAEDGYFTDELDPALASRFVQVRVVPDVEQWAVWANQSGVHGRIVEFITATPGVFDSPESNPRAWTYASAILTQWEISLFSHELLAWALAGTLGDHWAQAFVNAYRKGRRPLRPREIILEYPTYRSRMKRWVRQGYLDVVAATFQLLDRYFRSEGDPFGSFPDAIARSHIRTFIEDLPRELRRQVLTNMKDDQSSPLREIVQEVTNGHQFSF